LPVAGYRAESAPPPGGPADTIAQVGEEDPEAVENWLPVWTDGPYTNAFVVIQEPTYDFIIQGNGRGALHLKDAAGQPVAPPVWVGGFGLSYKKPGARLLTPRMVVKADNLHLKPLRNPASVELSGTAEDGVRFKSRYVFSKGSIKGDFSFEDPKNLEPRTGGGTGVRLFPFKPLDRKAPEEAVQALVSGWTVAVQAEEGGRTAFNYWESVKRFPRGIRRAVVKGPWGPREVAFEFTPHDAVGIIYQGMSLRNGYGFQCRTGGPRDSDRRLGIQVTVK
jgi:hypothetical protein